MTQSNDASTLIDPDRWAGIAQAIAEAAPTDWVGIHYILAYPEPDFATSRLWIIRTDIEGRRQAKPPAVDIVLNDIRDELIEAGNDPFNRVDIELKRTSIDDEDPDLRINLGYEMAELGPDE